ncbi:MAG: EAL domain-containing protein [Erysipelotrichaceae bacterium]
MSMKYRALPKKSIIYKILLPSVAALILQAIIFFAAIIYGGVFDQLQNNRLDSLSDQVANRKNYLENQMVQRWSNIDNYEQIFSNKIQDYLETYGASLNTLNNRRIDEILIQCNQDLQQMLRYSEATGAFLLLDQTNGSQEIPGIYISDGDPNTIISDNSDLLYQIAPSTLVKEQGIGMAQSWGSKFSSDTRNMDFYKKPLETLHNNPTLSPINVGYFSKPFKLTSQTKDVITYSVPIVDDNGISYGIYGISLKLDYISSFLPFDELVEDHSGSYYVEVKQDNTCSEILNNGDTYRSYVQKDGICKLKNKNVDSNTYQVKTKDNTSNDVYASSETLNLYSDNSPFADETWYLIGMATNRSLFTFSSKIMTLLGITLVLSCFAAIIGLLLMAQRIAKPITKLVEQVNHSNPDQRITLQKTNIDEIDNLANSILHLSKSVAKSASRFSQIIDLSGESIGAFEYVIGDQKVYCTNQFFTILQYPQNTGNYLDINIFDEIMDKASRHQVIDQEDVFCIQITSYRKKWIRIRKGQDGNRYYGVLLDVSNEMKERSKLLYERDHDVLTGLTNRRAFVNAMKDLLKSSDLKIGALLMWDLDNLKYVNDTYGHDYGDDYLQRAGKSLALFKKYNALVARMSGDEFYVFLYGFDCKEDIIQIINQQYKLMNDAFIYLPGGETFKVKVSMGLSWYPLDSTNYDELAKYSDFAMYKAKNTIKGHFVEFNKEIYQEESYLFEGVEILNRLFKEEKIQFALQPIINMKNGLIYGYEALMRSQIDYFKSPMEIIRIAKAQSKLYQLEQLTWKKAIALFDDVLANKPNCKLFINSVPNYILSRKDIDNIVKGKESFLNQIVMEITENDEISKDAMLAKIEIIKEWHAQMAMDDYGTGHNGELTLLTYPLQFVKIDMSIIRNLDNDLGRQKLVANIISYCHSQNIKVIGEGIETKNEFIKLCELGIDYGQGFLIGEPNFECKDINPEVISLITHMKKG